MGILKYLSSTYTYTRKNKVRVKAKMRGGGGGDAVVGSWEDFDGTSLHFPQSGSDCVSAVQTFHLKLEWGYILCDMHQRKTEKSKQKDQMGAHILTIHYPFLHYLSISFKTEFRVNAETVCTQTTPSSSVCLKHTS